MAQKADLSDKSMLARIMALNLTLLNFSRLVPRSPKKWIFGHTGKLFAGNSKYLFLWMKLHRPDIDASWLAHDEATYQLLRAHGLNCHRKWSRAGMLAALRSKVFLFCHGLTDINPRLSKSALLVNLWHGVGIKATMFGDTTGIMSDYRRRWTNWRGRMLFYEYVTLPDIVVTTSDFMQRHFASQFEMPAAQCPPLGYPRLDVATDPELRKLAIAIDNRTGFTFNEDGHKEVYLYMPTFRDTHRPFIDASLPDLARLSDVLSERNAVLYVKLHPWTLESWPGDLKNIRLWPNEVEVYTYLDLVTGLITDYSSILYDYLFLRDSGIILYTFDYDEYLTQDHSILYPFDENTVGVSVSDFEQLCAVIASGESLVADEAAAAVRAKFWGNRIAPMSPVVVDYIEDLLQERRAS